MSSESKLGIIAAKWNSSITDKLLEGALAALIAKGYKDEQITVARCPGAFEIPAAVQMLLPKVDGVVAIGAVIRGETPHFHYISEAVSSGIMQLNITHNKPVTFGVLTTDTVQQASERADDNSSFGNKGAEAALTLIEMLSLKDEINKR